MWFKKRGVNKIFVLPAFLLVFSMALSACAIPAGKQQAKNAIIQTAVVDSLVGTQAASTLTAIIQTPTSTPQPTTAVPATSTPTPTPSPYASPTMAGVWLTLQEDTYCFAGPGGGYEMLFFIGSNQLVEAMARDPMDDYYYIRDPKTYSQFCWIPGVVTSVSGDVSRLPVLTPEPLAAPIIVEPETPAMKDFYVYYEKTLNCDDSYGLVFYIENTGSVIWRSIRVLMTDYWTYKTYMHDSDIFRGTTSDPCVLDMENAQDDLQIGEGSPVACVNAGQFNYDPTGHPFSVRITLYSLDGRKGDSITKTLTFKP